MNFSQLKRAPNKVHETLLTTEDGKVITTKGCKIYAPARWAEQRLAFIGNDTILFGYFLIVVENAYYVCGRACTMFPLQPAVTKQVQIGDDSYLEFTFDPGTTVIKNLNCVMDDTLPYQMHHEFIELGKIPGYLSYSDQANLFESVIELCGVKLGANEAVLSAIASSVMKDPEDLGRSYAFKINSIANEREFTPAIVPFRDVQYGATNVTAKLMGSYSDLAITSALVNPSERNERFEDLLRK